MEPAPDTYRGAAALRTALRLFSRRSEQISRRHDLTPRQYLLLLMLKASEMRKSPATITDSCEPASVSSRKSAFRVPESGPWQV